MADNKNQHFVPRCHFKPFSVEGTGKAIHLFNLDRQRSIAGAPLRNQCSGDYFYGQDPLLEAAIRSVEDPYAGMVRHLTQAGAEIRPADAVVLRRFVYLQHVRTEAASIRAAQIGANLAAVPGALPEGEAFDVRRAMREAVVSAMRHYGESMKIVDDLNIVLVRNRTAIPFVTSDDPAVVANRWHQQNRRTAQRPFGVKSAGALLIMPLSPEVVAVLYDGDVYSIRNAAGWIEVDSPGDIAAINDHQVLNCIANLYFRDWATSGAVEAASMAVMNRRSAPRHEVRYAVKAESTAFGARYDVQPLETIQPEPGGEVLIHTVVVRRRPAAWPRFLAYRRDGKAYFNGTRAGFTRRWCLDEGFVTGQGYRKVKL